MWCKLCGNLCDFNLCPSCEQRLKEASYAFLYKEQCPVCGSPVLDQSYVCGVCRHQSYSYGPYGKTLATLIRRYKIDGERSLHPVLAALYTTMLSRIENPLLIPIPCSWEGYRRRGFDQMLCIAKYLEKTEGYRSLSLFKRRRGKQVKLLSKRDRLASQPMEITHAKRNIACFKHLVEAGYRVVLIDDVSASGTTMQQAKTLLSHTFGCNATGMVLTNV
ncbi:MAG: ComF family protein [Sphaerochaeta sp.]